MAAKALKIYHCNHICLVKDSTSGLPIELHNFALKKKTHLLVANKTENKLPQKTYI